MKELVYHRVFLPGLDAFGRAEDAIIDGAYRSTLAEHGDRVFRLAHALQHQLGVEPGDRVAVMSTNNHQYLELYHACFLGAAVINPLNLRLAGKELDYIIRDSGTEVIFVDGFFGAAIAQAMAASDAGPSPLRHVVLIGDPVDPDNPPPHDIAYEHLIAAGEAVVPDEPEEDDPVVLMYTGGTTGLPKGVLLDQRAEMLNSYHTLAVVDIDPAQVFLHQTPMFHAASMGAILGVPAFGAKSVFIPLFDPGAALSLVEEHAVTWTVMVPTMIGMLLNHPDFRPERLASLRQLTYGASPMPAAILHKLLELYPELAISQGYGMTEASAVLTWLSAGDHFAGGERLRSAGRPLPGVILSIQDAEGTVLSKGETGEVCARAGNFMREYWNKPEATEEVFRGGWYHTGDAGYLDEGGYLFLVDRVKDMIVTGGENVYSAEVESAISKHEAVAQVAVIGIPHETWGEQVHAIVVLVEDGTATEDEIRDFAKDHIAGYKVPKSVEFRTEPLPLSGAMKVLKKDLRAPYWEGQERAVN
jgi:acyl-CoA synthetase (AMP-forming)/AMP-acid ligase II